MALPEPILRTALLITAMAAALGGCARAPLMPSPAFAPVLPQASAATPASTGSIFIDGRGDNLFGQWLGFFREHLSTFVAAGVLLPLTLALNWLAVGW